MPTGTVTGLSSGLDWGNIVDMMMQIERQPVDLLEYRRSEYQSKLTNWSVIEGKLKALKSEADDLDTLNEFLSKSATSTDTDVIKLTASADAMTGKHSIIVNQLATNHTHAHKTGWTDLNTTALNTSGSDQVFSYDYNGETYNVTVPDGTTMGELVNLINNDPDNEDYVTASVIDDGSGGANPIHMIISGNDTGSGYDVSINDAETTLNDGALFDSANWEITQTAQNSEIRVDGFPDPAWGWPNPWIESDSNDVEDVIPGVILHLQDTSDGDSVEIETSLDTVEIKSSISSLVSKFNDLIDTINTLSSYDAENETSGPLAGDSLARNIKDDLLLTIAQNIPGTDENDDYRSLGQVGISLSSGGKLSIDNEELEEALEEDPAAVARLFIFSASSSEGYVSVSGHNENTVGGTYNFTLSYDANGNLVKSGTNTINGDDAIVHGNSLVGGAIGTDVEGLLMMLSNPGDGPGSLSGSVQVYTGLSVLLSNAITDLTDSYDGQLKSNRDQINDNIDLLDDKIENWERRLDIIEDSYNRKFSQMETLISQMNSTSSYLSAL
ncbi:flagellar filament capping protein FliD [bacterium]|nr:flagellar filament capping protein FliD [bacterium]